MTRFFYVVILQAGWKKKPLARSRDIRMSKNRFLWWVLKRINNPTEIILSFSLAPAPIYKFSGLHFCNKEHLIIFGDRVTPKKKTT